MADSNSSVMGAAARRGMNVSPADEAALRSALRALQGVQDPDPRVKGLMRVLALLHPEDGGGSVEKGEEDHAGRVSVALMKAQEIAADPNVAPLIRESARESARSLQVTHLAGVNPRAAEQWEHLHPAA